MLPLSLVSCPVEHMQLSEHAGAMARALLLGSPSPALPVPPRWECVAVKHEKGGVAGSQGNPTTEARPVRCSLAQCCLRGWSFPGPPHNAIMMTAGTPLPGAAEEPLRSYMEAAPHIRSLEMTVRCVRRPSSGAECHTQPAKKAPRGQASALVLWSCLSCLPSQPATEDEQVL